MSKNEHKHHRTYKFKSECNTEPSQPIKCCEPECQFTIHLDNITLDNGALFFGFPMNPFIGDNNTELYGMANYQLYRGNISDSQFFEERSEAEGWLQKRYGLTIFGYAPLTNFQYYFSEVNGIYGLPNMTDVYVAFAVTNETSNSFFGTNGGILSQLYNGNKYDLKILLSLYGVNNLLGTDLITLFYIPYISLQDYCVNSSNCVCNKSRVALLEHRYFANNNLLNAQYLFSNTSTISYISYGYMQLYKENNINAKPHKTYTYRYLYPLFITQYSTSSNYSLNFEVSITYAGGTLAEISRNDNHSNSCDKVFDGIFNFTVDNTYYATIMYYDGTYLPNVCNFSPAIINDTINNSPTINSYFSFYKKKNAIHNRFIGTVTFGSLHTSEVEEQLAKFGIVTKDVILNINPQQLQPN